MRVYTKRLVADKDFGRASIVRADRKWLILIQPAAGLIKAVLDAANLWMCRMC